MSGGPQADHIETKPNGDKKETSPTISTYCRTFFTFSSCLKDPKRDLFICFFYIYRKQCDILHKNSYLCI